MSTIQSYDAAIIGGGLAGLSLAIQLRKNGHSVILFEKETYPFHKVCGEYISMESWPFLQSLGVPLADMKLPSINKLIVSAPNGTVLQANLPLGGFGISRYSLDNLLKEIAVQTGVVVKENCKVNDVDFSYELFTISTMSGQFQSKVCCGCYGKKSNLDVKWKRLFTLNNYRKLNQFTGIKYHIETSFPADSIALHNFKNGYCGISKIEDNRYCLCYLTHTDNLKDSEQSIEQIEANILSKNPMLKELFRTSKKLYESPLSISQVSFLPKSKIEHHVLLMGDAAGLITPLCGNGMSIAMHTSKIASLLITSFLSGSCNRLEMEQNYTRQWEANFAKRLWYGRLIQSLFGKEQVTNVFIKLLRKLPAVTDWLIRQTHGEPF